MQRPNSFETPVFFFCGRRQPIRKEAGASAQIREAPREKALGYVCGIQVKRALVPAVFENKRGFANTAAAGLKLISEAPWKTRSRAAWG